MLISVGVKMSILGLEPLESFVYNFFSSCLGGVTLDDCWSGLSAWVAGFFLDLSGLEAALLGVMVVYFTVFLPMELLKEFPVDLTDPYLCVLFIVDDLTLGFFLRVVFFLVDFFFFFSFASLIIFLFK